MAAVELKVEISDVFIAASDREKTEFVDLYYDELFDALTDKIGFIANHLEDANIDDIVEFLRKTGDYNIEEI